MLPDVERYKRMYARKVLERDRFPVRRSGIRAIVVVGSIRALVEPHEHMSRNTPFQILKRFVTGTEDSDGSDGSYECRNCGEKFDRQHPVCPNCGQRSIEATDWEVQSEDVTQSGGGP